MITTHLPATVEEYFRRMDTADKTAVAKLFTPDACVLDDGNTYQGRAAILSWLTGPASQYTTTSTRLSADQHSLHSTVLIALDGDFPGGHVELRHRFEQDQSGLLTGLSITVSETR